jgi:hypothetical protein
MNKPAQNSDTAPPPEPSPEPLRKSPNLFLLYGLLILGMLVAGTFAAMIVWPFYLRR